MTGNELFSFPFNRIPVEIWANIFIMCLPPQRYIQPNTSQAPLLLCQVNRAWRSTALSLSELWSSISVELCERSDVERKLEGIGAWLGRSGVRPLTISLHSGGVDLEDLPDLGWRDWESEVFLDPILDLFISLIGRWEDIQWKLLGPFYGSILSIHLFRAPLLKRFEIDFNLGTSEVTKPLFSMLSTSPLLTDFVWHDNSNEYVCQFHKAEFTLPWSQLTQFHTHHHLDVKTCLQVFGLCPNLIGCTLSFAILGPPWTAIPPGVSVVHKLQALTLWGQRYQTNEFFDHLTLPALSAFALESSVSNHDTGWPQDSFVGFLSRSGCHLKTFKVHTPALSSYELVDLLCLLPTLTELSIEGLGDTLFHSLTYDETTGGSCLCPKLEIFAFGGYFNSSDGTLARMLESRYHSDASQSQNKCLRRVTIMLTDRYGYRRLDMYMKELETIRKKGLRVVVEKMDRRRRLI